jgi:hypothetical protein
VGAKIVISHCFRLQLRISHGYLMVSRTCMSAIMCINLFRLSLVIFKVKAIILVISQLACGKNWPGLLLSSGGPAIMGAS